MSGARPIPWLTDARALFIDDATTWIRDSVSSLGLEDPEKIEPVREQPWGIVMRVSLPDRDVYFKAEGLGGTHEPPLVRDIRAQWPELVPDVLALDETRAWMLMGDNGRPLWDVVDDPVERLRVFEEILPLYAQMQRGTTDHLETWMTYGVPDRRVSKLPRLLDELLGGQTAIGELPIDAELRRAIDSCLPDLAVVCAELDATPVPDALDHSDLHGGNVLVSSSERPRLVDWGDACITHPFASPFATFQLSFAKIAEDQRLPLALRLRDVYLQAWSDIASRDELVRWFSLAIWTAHVTRALDFSHMLQGIDDDPALLAEWQGYTKETLAFWQRWHAVLRDEDAVIEGVVAHSYI